MTSSEINFGIGTSAINESSIASLERLRDLAIGCQNAELVVEIGGHTDSQGAEAANLALSESRAQAVLDFMAARGVSFEGMRAVGFGEAQPIATNDTNVGRAANRRITFDWRSRETAPEIVDG